MIESVNGIGKKRSCDELGGNLNSDGVRERCSLKLCDLVSHGGREEVGVALLWHDLEDLVDDRAEVKVEQTVGLVENLVGKVGYCRRVSVRPARVILQRLDLGTRRTEAVSSG
jgi:hypothetical protein